MKIEDIINRLAKISQPQRFAIYGCSFVLAIVVYLFVFYFASQDEIGRLNRLIAEHDGKLEQTEDQH